MIFKKLCLNWFRHDVVRYKSVSSSLQRGIEHVDKDENNQLSYQVIKPGLVSPELTVPKFVTRPDYTWSNLIRSPFKSRIEKNSEEMTRRMKETCSLAGDILRKAASILEPGITTDFIDTVIHNEIVKHGAYPSTLRYKGFPKSCCTSINNIVCHGIPDDNVLENGDIINIDITVFYLGCHGDTSDTFEIGRVDETGSHLVETTQKSLQRAIDICKPGTRFLDIPEVIEPFANENGFQVCRRFVGHGIGANFHAAPNVWHVRSHHADHREMEPGMIFTIEPILMEGDDAIRTSQDGWTIVSKDDLRSAQSEHTILITTNGHEVLTL